MNKLSIATLILLPFLGFIINFFFGNRIPKTMSGILGSITVLGSFIISCSLFSHVLSNESGTTLHLFQWINIPGFAADFNVLIDRLSVLMLLIITGVGFLIHVYSIGYMKDDDGFARFFAYLNLFIFFMQVLVLGENYVVTFIGWEGVGLCSYLLIGFWFKNQEYNNAAKKAFIMNRIGDLGFLIGVFMIYEIFGTLSYSGPDGVFAKALSYSPNETFIVLITLLLFVGAVGKSAQIPLFTWLPDAMAGPTPVSALIHAATMVTAGIYLVVRSHVLYALAPTTLAIVAGIGVATAIFAATIGLKQNDIKKVLAYSTVSQLGYMFLALGVGAYVSGMFHLLTHAFFKALLFLGAGSVIHAMSGEQDIRNMGGLRKKLPITFITFLIGTLAISGIPPFSGFFSKDEILAHAFESNMILWIIGLITAFFTAIYMFRLLYMTFYGNFRGTEEQRHHLHESPSTITIPLIILAILATIGGFVGIPSVFGATHWLNNYFEPFLADLPHSSHTGHAISHQTEYILMATTIGLSLVALFLARHWYIKKNVTGEQLIAQPSAGISKVLENKYYVDELYDSIIVKPLYSTSVTIYKFIESNLIDGIVNGAAKATSEGGRYLRYLQSGNIGFYIFAMVIGILILFLYLAKNMIA